MASEISTEEILRHLHALIGNRYPFSSQSNIIEAENYIFDQLRHIGLEVKKHFFDYEGGSFANLIGRKAGLQNSCFIVGAHFDAVDNCPGADDNASGVAALLETARVLAPEKLRHSIEFACFNLEEFGMLGSSAYVKDLQKEKREIIGMVSLEMIGYTDSRKGSQQLQPALVSRFRDTGDFIALVANGKSKDILQIFCEQFRKIENLPLEHLSLPFNGWLLPPSRLSGHSPFWDAGYPALLITDTSFFRNPHYHLSSDTFKTLNVDFIRKVAQGVTNAVRTIASA